MDLLPQLESNDHVAKYFWCAATVEQAMQFPFLVNSHLIEGKGEQPIRLTEVGKYFADFSYRPPSPTPPAPPSPVQASLKKGVAVQLMSSTNKRLQLYDCSDFKALGVSNFINWGQKSGCENDQWADSIHIPQIWGSTQVGQVP